MLFRYYILLLIQGIALSNSAKLNGGLAFSEADKNGQIYVNLNRFLATRTADTNILNHISSLGMDIVNRYYAHCNQVSNLIAGYEVNKTQTKMIQQVLKTVSHDVQDEVIISPIQVKLMEAPEVCKSLGAQLPELKTMQDKEFIRLAALNNKIGKIYAGVKFDNANKLFRFNSDQQNARTGSPFQNMQYGGPYTGSKHQGHWESDKWIASYANDYPVIYTDPRTEFAIRIADENEKNHKTAILCTKKRSTTAPVLSEHAYQLLQIADNACQRDGKTLLESAQVILNEMRTITNLDLAKQPQEEQFSTRNRREIEDCDDMTQDFLEINLHYLHFMSGSKADILDWLSDLLPRILEAIKMKVRETPDTEILERLRESFNESYPMTMEEKLRKHLVEVEVYEVLSCAVYKQAKDLETSTTETLSPTSSTIETLSPTSSPIETLSPTSSPFETLSPTSSTIEDMTTLSPIISTPRQSSSSQMKTYLPEVRTKRALQRTMEDRMKENMKNGKQSLTKRGRKGILQATEQAFNTLMSQLHKKGAGKGRQKRSPIAPLAIGLGIAGGLAATNVAASLATGDAPLSWLGDITSSILGFSSNAATQRNLIKMDKMAEKFDALQVNQKELSKTIHDIKQKMETFENHLDGIHVATEAIATEQDLKAHARHVQNVQMSTLNKYANILLAGASKKVSPFALSQTELNKLADNIRAKEGLDLARNLERIDMQVAIVNNELKFFFSIPIIEDDHIFHFYKVVPIPVFADNKTFIPELDASNIAISKSGSEYISLTDLEYQKCTEDPDKCVTTSLISPISSSSSCVITTYTSQTLRCPLKETTQTPTPFFWISGNSTIFSMPAKTKLFIKCKEFLEYEKYTDETIEIEGIGEASFKTGCSITLPNGSKFKTPTIRIAEQLSESKIFELMKIFPVPTDVKIKRLDQEVAAEAPEINFEDVSFPSWDTLKKETFHPQEIIPFLSRTLFTTGIIIALVILFTCICPCSRKRLNKWYEKKRQNAQDDDTENASDIEFNSTMRRRSKNPIKDAIHRSMESLYHRYESLNSVNKEQPPTKQMPPSCLRRSQSVHEIKRNAPSAPGNLYANAQDKRKSVTF